MVVDTDVSFIPPCPCEEWCMSVYPEAGIIFPSNLHYNNSTSDACITEALRYTVPDYALNNYRQCFYSTSGEHRARITLHALFAIRKWCERNN